MATDKLSAVFAEHTSSEWSAIDSLRAQKRVRRRLMWRKRRIVAQNAGAMVLLALAPMAFAQMSERREEAAAPLTVSPPLRAKAFAAQRLVADQETSPTRFSAPRSSPSEKRTASSIETAQEPRVSTALLEPKVQHAPPIEPLDSMFARSDIARREGKPLVAIEILERARLDHALDSRAFLVSFTLGKLYADTSDKLEAAAAFRRVYTRWPGCALAEAAKARERELKE